MRRIAPRGVLSAVVAVTLVVLGAPAAESASASPNTASPSAASGDLSEGSDCATTYPQRSVTSERPDGATQSYAANDNLAHVHHYSVEGSDVTMVEPPQGWSPVTASDQELRTYGFPARPTDPTILKSWNDDYSHWRKAEISPSFCSTGRSNITRTSGSTPNWGGGLALNGGPSSYFEASGQWNQAGFDAVCPGASSYSTWDGLGGYNTGKLLQTGTDSSQSDLNGVYAWWEAIRPGFDTREMMFSGSSVIFPGDRIKATTNYGGGSVSFQVYDVTIGRSWSLGPVSSISSTATSSYYDGTTADFVTERPSGGPEVEGKYYYLRKPHDGTTAWPQANVNVNQNISTHSSRALTMRGAHLLQTTNFDGVHSWTNYWQACS